MMREKAAADEEENRVASFAADVTHKQRECEQDLEKAEPALVAAQEALNTLNKVSSFSFSFPVRFILYFFAVFLFVSLFLFMFNFN